MYRSHHCGNESAGPWPEHVKPEINFSSRNIVQPHQVWSYQKNRTSSDALWCTTEFSAKVGHNLSSLPTCMIIHHYAWLKLRTFWHLCQKSVSDLDISPIWSQLLPHFQTISNPWSQWSPIIFSQVFFGYKFLWTKAKATFDHFFWSHPRDCLRWPNVSWNAEWWMLGVGWVHHRRAV